MTTIQLIYEFNNDFSLKKDQKITRLTFELCKLFKSKGENTH